MPPRARGVLPRPPDEPDLYGLYRTHLAPHKTPARWFQATELPLTGSGKIQKFRLGEQIVRAELDELSPHEGVSR